MTLVAPRFHARRTPRPAAALLIGAGAALLPWMVVLAKTLPHTAEVSNWSTAWIGLDAVLATCLGGTGLLLRRHDPRAAPLAAATAALLVMDAWFDVTTAVPGSARATATALAVCAELPLAALCTAVAVRLPGDGRSGPGRYA